MHDDVAAQKAMDGVFRRAAVDRLGQVGGCFVRYGHTLYEGVDGSVAEPGRLEEHGQVVA